MSPPPVQHFFGVHPPFTIQLNGLRKSGWWPQILSFPLGWYHCTLFVLAYHIRTRFFSSLFSFFFGLNCSPVFFCFGFMVFIYPTRRLCICNLSDSRYIYIYICVSSCKNIWFYPQQQKPSHTLGKAELEGEAHVISYNPTFLHFLFAAALQQQAKYLICTVFFLPPMSGKLGMFVCMYFVPLACPPHRRVPLGNCVCHVSACMMNCVSLSFFFFNPAWRSIFLLKNK